MTMSLQSRLVSLKRHIYITGQCFLWICLTEASYHCLLYVVHSLTYRFFIFLNKNPLYFVSNGSDKPNIKVEQFVIEP